MAILSNNCKKHAAPCKTDYVKSRENPRWEPRNGFADSLKAKSLMVTIQCCLTRNKH